MSVGHDQRRPGDDLVVSPLICADFALADNEVHADVGLDDGHAVFPCSGQDGLILVFGLAAVGRDQDDAGSVEDEGANDIGVPAVVADDKAGAADRRVEGAQLVADAVEVPGGMGALRQLDFVVAATDFALLIEEESAVVGFIADALGESEGEAGFQRAGELLEAADVGAVDGFGHFDQGFGAGAAFDYIHDDIAFERALGNQDQARFFLRGLDEQFFHSVGIVISVPLGGSIGDCGYFHAFIHGSFLLELDLRSQIGPLAILHHPAESSHDWL